MRQGKQQKATGCATVVDNFLGHIEKKNARRKRDSCLLFWNKKLLGAKGIATRSNVHY